MIKRYPFDPTGQSPDNLVRDEIHTLDDYFDDFYARIILPRYGAYFNDSLIVKQDEKILTLNKDYQLTFFWQDPTIKTGKPVSRAIQIINKRLAGDITITYQVVGDKFQDTNKEVMDLVERLPMNLRNVYWDEVLEIPYAYYPERHIHHINDVFGLTRLVAVVDDLRRSLQNQSVLKLKSVYDRFLKLKQWVEDNVSDIDEQRKFLMRLTDNINETLANVITREQLNEAIDAKITSEPEHVSQQIDKLEIRITTNNDKIREVNERLDIVRTEITERITEVATAINLRIDNERDENRLKFVEHDKDIEKLKAKDDELKTKLEQEVTRLTNDIENKDRGVRRDLGQSIVETKVAIENDRERLLRETRTDYDSKINELKNQSKHNLDELKQRVDNHDEKLEELKEEVKANDLKHIERENGLSDDIIALRNKHQEDVDAINSAINSGRENTKQLVDNLAANSETERQKLLTKINENRDKINTDIGRIDTELEDINESLSEVNNKIDEGVSQKTRELDERLEALDGKVTNQNERVNQLETSTNENAQFINNLNRSLDAARADIANDLAEANKQINDIKDNKLPDLERRLEVEENKSDTFDNQIQTNNRRLDALERDNQNIKTNVNVLTEKDKELADRVAENKSLADDNKRRLDELEPTVAKVDNIESDVNTIKETMERNGNVSANELTLLKQKVNTNENTLNQAVQKNAEQDTRLDELTQKANNDKTELANKISENKQNADSRLNGLNTSLNNLNNKVTEVSEKLNTLNDTTVLNLKNKVDRLEESSANHDRSLATLSDGLNNAESTANEANRIAKTTQNDLETAKTNITTQQDELNTIKDNLTTQTEKVEQNKNDIDELKNQVGNLQNNPQGENFNEDELSRLVKIAIDRHIAERRALNPDEEIPEPDTFIVSPESEGSIRFQNDDTLTVYPISIMDNNIQHSEMERYVFTPNTVFEFGRSSTWTVPDIYDRLIAQVYVTSAIKGRTLPSGKVLYYPPSTRLGYVILKGGMNVSITVGEVSSFGQWLTNDGTNKKGTITPTYPISTDVSSALTQNEDIRNMFGKLGKVVIIV